jgi:hypothetical protein
MTRQDHPSCCLPAVNYAARDIIYRLRNVRAHTRVSRKSVARFFDKDTRHT